MFKRIAIGLVIAAVLVVAGKTQAQTGTTLGDNIGINPQTTTSLLPQSPAMATQAVMSPQVGMAPGQSSTAEATARTGVRGSATTSTAADQSWRYRFDQGFWWYWLPSNRWAYWSGNQWFEYAPHTTPEWPGGEYVGGYRYQEPSEGQPAIGSAPIERR
jgi:hypothetical protein